MKISIYIPTIPSHFKYLNNIIDIYLNKSTIKPDEICIGVSESNLVKDDIEYLNKKYDVTWFLSEEKMDAGTSRKKSIDCKGDLIIYQDSDDLPHIQRIEIIKQYFERENVLHLNHSFSKIEEFNENKIKLKEYISSDTIYRKYFTVDGIKNNCKKFTFYGEDFKFLVAAGTPAIKKEVLYEVQWKSRNELSYSYKWNDPKYKGAEDFEFCMDVLYHFNKSIMIDSKIYFYNK